nr:glycosyltransferase [Rubellimicrobium aerolatum]
MGGGGIGVVMLNLAEGLLARGHAVDLLLLDEAQGRPAPAGARVVRVGARARQALPAVARHLRESPPDLIVSARDYVNLLLLAGRRLAGLQGRSRLVWTYHTHAASQHRLGAGRTARLAGWIGERLIRWPEARVAVSQGVARDLEARLALPPGAVDVIGNPVWTPARLARRDDPCPHPWLAGRLPGGRDPLAPVILGIGRLAPQKDFPTLLHAFARLRAARPAARLLILGDGDRRSELEGLIRDLGLSGAVDLPGHVPDPLPYLSRADLFTLSSRWEGFSLALVEALGCGCAVVSTDCPSGPAEILEAGRLGPLVPPGDPEALAAAMARALDTPGDPRSRKEAGLRFGSDGAARAYLAAVGLDG